MAHRGILDLPPEVMRMILDCIEDDPEKLISFDRREYLSQESFRIPAAPTHDQAEVVANFRLVCRKFSALGAIHQFARVTTRFSRAGFNRLENIANDLNIAQHVKKFTFMVPCFYAEGREHINEVLPELQQTVGFVNVDSFARKIADQRYLVHSRDDARIMTKAIAAFTSLQHVQLLRVQDRDDAVLLTYMRQNEHLINFVDLNWASACAHSTSLLGAAILAAPASRFSRFSSPMLSLQTSHTSVSNNIVQLDILAHKLTSLELHFDDAHNLEHRITELSPFFNLVFQAASNLQALHLGFPVHKPLDLGLEHVFFNVKWKNLSAFGIQAWKLDAKEIIAFAQRHRETLRGLRLRNVLLREPSMWQDVLAYLRKEFLSLKWISLRRIGYARHFEVQMGAAGAEVPDDPPEDASDSSDETEEEEELLPDIPSSDPLVAAFSDPGSDENDSDGDSDAGEDDEEFGPQAHEMGFPESTLTAGPQSPRGDSDTSDFAPANMEDLEDNGLFVTNLQRKQWEQWVIRHGL